MGRAFVSALPFAASLLAFVPGKAEAQQSFAEPLSPQQVRGITIQIPAEHALASGGIQSRVGRKPITFAGPGEPPLPIYMNRNGGTYRPGNDDSRQNTSIVPNRASTVSAFSGTNAEWNQVVDCITTMWAPYNVVIVEQEPSGGEYIESVVGGTPQQVGLPNGVGGVAPIDSFQCNIIPNAIVFTFADVVGNDPQTTCEIAAQEIAHAISLDHEYHCPDPMTYLGGCGDKTFRDYDAQCGEYSPRACNCGRPSQNSVEVLIEKLGTNSGMPPPPPPNDPIPPVVSIISPADGANLPQDSTIQVVAEATDDMTLSATELIWEFSNAVFPCPTNQNAGSVTCTRSGNTSTWSLRVGQGDRRFSVRARDAANNVTTTPTRTIHLGTGQPTPVDTIDPTVSVTSPADGDTLLANSTIRVVATAGDDMGLASVDLVWSASTDSTFPCPFNGQGVACAVNNGTYTWELAVGVGTRRFSVRATDLAGNQSQTAQRTIILSTDTGQPPPVGQDTVAEPNNSPGEAFPARCGNAIDLVITDNNDDWFSFDAPAGTTVEVAVAAALNSIIAVHLYAANGTTELGGVDDILANGGSVSAVSQGPTVIAKINTNGPAATYRLTALCTNMMPPVMPPIDDSLEENDEPGTATRLVCGDNRTSLTAADPDYFVVNVPEHQTLKATITGVGVQGTILNANGEVLAQPGLVLTAPTAPAGDLWVKIEPTMGTTTYESRFECVDRGGSPMNPENPQQEIPDRVNSGQLGGGCACSSSAETSSGAAYLFAVALVALLIRRRRW